MLRIPPSWRRPSELYKPTLVVLLAALVLATAVASAVASWWVRHGWVELYPICTWDFTNYERLVSPLRPNVRAEFIKNYWKYYGPDLRMDNGHLMARPHVQYFNRIGNRRWTGYAVADFSAREFSIGCRDAFETLTMYSLGYRGGPGQRHFEPLPDEWLLDILEFLAFYPEPAWRRNR